MSGAERPPERLREPGVPERTRGSDRAPGRGSDDDELLVAPSRKSVMRALGVFYLKLVLDGFKDVVLLPLAAIAAFLDLMKKTDEERESLGRVIHFGERFDRWLNLYGSESHGEGLGAVLGEGGSDVLLDYVERRARDLKSSRGAGEEKPPRE
jgi:hypothetical protein